jgi:hypothetical protein
MSDGEIRLSQIVTTFGPGAMVDMPDASVIVAGLDHWHYEPGSIPEIKEPRLVEKLKRILGVTDLTLRLPPSASEVLTAFDRMLWAGGSLNGLLSSTT